ncbi:glycosyltransferase family 4 protein [Microgenomates group bacterium]|nr:glycosyltransferase family 4 protein [Microgenomates group bacterium]
MKICFYSPYLPKHFGGGEKYLFDVAETFTGRHEVYIAISQSQKQTDLEKIKQAYSERFGEKIEKLRFIWTPIGEQNAGTLKRLLWTAKFDAFYYISDGSLFFSLARHNILHIQIPFTIPKTRFVDRLKLQNWKNKNAISIFTKKVIEKYWQVKVQEVVYPGVELESFGGDKEMVKEKIVLNIGRFFQQLHSKKQDVLVDFWRDICDKYPQIRQEWQLVLIGNIEDQYYANQVALKAQGYPIKIIHQANNEQVRDYCRRASIYWHATGFGADETDSPEKMEHFGISTVEAMAAGCVPLVIDKGGQREIVGRKLKDCLWGTKQECMDKTYSLMTRPKLRAMCGKAAQERAQKFSMNAFHKKARQLIK